MNTPIQPRSPVPLALRLTEIAYALFRHRWLILGAWALGLLAAAAFYFATPKKFRSEAKLLVRYVRESRAVDTLGGDAQVTSPDRSGQNIINSELEILSSLDLAREVAEVVGPARILGTKGNNTNSFLAASAIIKGLRIQVPPRSSVIKVTFDHSDPEVAHATLRALIDAYLKRHIEIHRALGVIDEFLAQQVDQARAKLTQAEEELRKQRQKIGSISLDDAMAANAAQLARVQQEILTTQAALGELGVFPTNLDTRLLVPVATTGSTNASASTNTAAAPQPSSARAATSNTNAPAPEEVIDRYKTIRQELAGFRNRELDLLLRFTEDSPMVQQVRQQIAKLDQMKKELEARYPDLILLDVPAPALVQPGAGPVNEAARRTALMARLRVLYQQLDELRREAARIDEVSSLIRSLERNRALAETNYIHLSRSLEQARFDQALDPSKTASISRVQEPSPAWPVSSGRTMGAATILALGIIGGIGLALLVGLFLDQSVHSPVDVETQLHLPLCLSIPDLGRDGQPRPRKPKGPQPAPASEAATPEAQAEGWTLDPALRSYCDTLRDQLMLDFHARNLTHKPKLVGITSCTRAAGVTTVAAGLAQSLSETGDGSVLLVELNLQQGVGLSHFYHGKPGFTLTQMLDGGILEGTTQPKGLYLVSAGDSARALTKSVPQKLAELMPKLKVSQFDYIIFDMPPVNLTTPTAKLAGLLDMTLLVLDSDKTPRAAVKRALNMLRESDATVMTILNRTRPHLPKWLEQRLTGT